MGTTKEAAAATIGAADDLLWRNGACPGRDGRGALPDVAAIDSRGDAGAAAPRLASVTVSVNVVVVLSASVVRSLSAVPPAAVR